MKSKDRRLKTIDHRPKARVQKPKISVHKEKGAKEIKDHSIPVYNSKGKEIERFALDKELFSGEVNRGVLYQVLLMYNANRRSGTASTKTRRDVSGGGKKPWRQKGTGRARAGSIRSPLWRGGGVIFGPHPRDFHYDLPKKIKKVALLSSLNSKFVDNKMLGIDMIDIDEPKTKKFKAVLDALKLKGKSLFVLDGIDEKIKRASRNLKEVCIKNYKDFSTIDVLTCENIVISKPALGKWSERFKV